MNFRNTLSFLAQEKAAILCAVEAMPDLAPSAAAISRHRGRPSKYSEKLARSICQDVARGVPVTKAFMGNSIGLQTGYDWLHARPAFCSAVRSAQSHWRKMQAIRHYLSSEDCRKAA